MVDELFKVMKEKLYSGKAVYGISIASRNPVFVEMAGYSGFDFVFIDTQHVPIGSDLTLENLIRAAEASNIVPIVRVKENEEFFIRCALEAGAKGVVIPRVSCKEDAIKAVNAAKFPPAGTRHGNPSVRAAKWGCNFDWDTYVKKNNEEILIIPLVEDKKGIDNLKEIIAVEGVNALSYGPTDYALSLGLNLNYDYDNPVVDEAFQKCLKLAREKGIPVIDSFQPVTSEKSQKLCEMGMNFQLVGSDKGILSKGLKSIIDELKS
jgi:4-hydroxy-2-oxoheptanedioate aldolase